MLLIQLFISHKHEGQVGRIHNLWIVSIHFSLVENLLSAEDLAASILEVSQ